VAVLIKNNSFILYLYNIIIEVIKMNEFYCEYCGRKFGYKHHLIRHIKTIHKILTYTFDESLLYKCKYCNMLFNKKYLGYHVAHECDKNPNYLINKQKMINGSKKKIGICLSEEHKEKIKKTISKKIKDDTWHTSFAKHRTFEYNGIKFHGMWEVQFAQYLDRKNIQWRRPNESFLYKFEEKYRRYIPDFFIEDEQCYYEIKGYVTEKDIAKWTQFPLKLKILTGEDLEKINIFVDYRKQKLNFEKTYNIAW